MHGACSGAWACGRPLYRISCLTGRRESYLNHASHSRGCIFYIVPDFRSFIALSLKARHAGQKLQFDL